MGRPSTLVIILLAHGVLLAHSAWVHSPTHNEPGHLVGGLYFWEYGRFDVFRVNPPLVRITAALPVEWLNPVFDWSAYRSGVNARCDTALGADFFKANGRRAFALLAVARMACIPFSLLGGWVAWAWARQLYGPRAAFLAALLWAAHPMILGHAAVIATDLASASFSLAAGYAFWIWLRSGDWPAAIIAGITLGLALLTKFTLAVLVPLWVVLWLGWRLTARWGVAVSQETAGPCPGSCKHGGSLAVMPSRPSPLVPRPSSLTSRPSPGWWSGGGKLAVTLVVALATLNAGYAFDQCLLPVGHYRTAWLQLQSPAETRIIRTPAEGLEGLIDSIPVPLPGEYLLGFMQQADDVERSRESYLGGVWRSKGWSYYYVYGLALKTPAGGWVLFLISAWLALGGSKPRGQWRDEFVLLAPAGAVLALVSAETTWNHHLRYALPALPPLFVWLGQCVDPAASPNRTLRGLAWTAACAACLSALAVHPHSLGYFNEVAGGPRNGHRHLSHSAVDWGQDLLFLERWLSVHRDGRKVYLAWNGQFDPSICGFEFEPAVPSLRPIAGSGGSPRDRQALLVVSVLFLQGKEGSMITSGRRTAQFRRDQFREFVEEEPIGWGGYSIRVYEVEEAGGTFPDQ
jgi:4-amino-4-deoxy-L-arabinose transferase-like glycosyltransferase